MQKSSEFIDWLKQQESEGKIESEGRFTISQDKAWDKLAAFQLPFPEAWVVKLVQAGVAHPQAGLNVRQTSEETAFLFTGVADWTRNSVEQAVHSHRAEDRRDFGHLAVALRALFQIQDQPFSIQYPDGQHVGWNGTEFLDLQGTEALPTEESLVVRVAHFPVGQSRSIFSLGNSEAAQKRAAIALALTEHCHYCPQVITLDRRPLNGYLFDSVFGMTDKSSPLAVFQLPADPLLESLDIEASNQLFTTDFGTHQVSLATTLQENAPLQCSSGLNLISLFFRKRLVRSDIGVIEPVDRRSQFIWVADGVVVQREPMPIKNAVGIGIVLSADGLETDLTGLQPRDSQEKLARKRAAFEVAKCQLMELEKSLHGRGVEVTHTLQSPIKKGLIGAFLCVVFPIFGFGYLTRLGFQYKNSNEKMKELDRVYDQELRNLCMEIARLDLA